MQETARYIRSHHELWDGKGYPDGLSGEQIPLGARILAVANEYDALQAGSLTATKMSPKDARDFIVNNSGKRYDPRVVTVFVGLATDSALVAPVEKGTKIASRELRAGMTMTERRRAVTVARLSARRASDRQDSERGKIAGVRF